MKKWHEKEQEIEIGRASSKESSVKLSEQEERIKHAGEQKIVNDVDEFHGCGSEVHAEFLEKDLDELTSTVQDKDEAKLVQPQPTPAKRSRGKKRKEANEEEKPKRNMSLWMLYSNANNSRVREENPGISFGQVVSTLLSL